MSLEEMLHLSDYILHPCQNMLQSRMSFTIESISNFQMLSCGVDLDRKIIASFNLISEEIF